MKITYNAKENIYTNYKKIANKGCEKCPICGETRESQLCNSEYSGIISTVGIKKVEVKVPKLFTRKKFCKTKYKCLTCGSTYESEVYEVRKYEH